MAAAMAAMTMVTKNKGGSLAMDKKKWFLPPLPDPEVAFRWSSRPECRSLDFPRRALFASVGLSLSVGAPPGSRQYDEKARPAADVAGQLAAAGEAAVQQAMEPAKAKKKQPGLRKVRVKIGNPHLRRLVSGAIAGAVSRTFVAPLETIRTHLMVGSSGVDDSMAGVFRWIMRTEGWPGLFRGNAVNVLRVAPSKAIEHFVYDTAKKHLSPEAGKPAKVPVPTPLVAGALAGVASTLCTYPMELVKTRLTIEKDAYDNLLHAFVKIARDEGPGELYRGLAPSLIGVVPYAATNFYAYETLRGVYRRATGKEEVGNVPTLLIGSAAGAIASAATFPLEVARKQMQVGAVGGRQVYKNLLHAMYCILHKEGAAGLYRGLGPSCIKLMPAAGISFMCYEACKKILVDGDVDHNGVEPREGTGQTERQAAPKKSNGDRVDHERHEALCMATVKIGRECVI